MSDKPVPEYYSIKQLCEKWGFDLNQLQLAIEKYNICLSICVTNKRRPLDNEPVTVLEAKINTLQDAEFFRLCKLSNDQLKSEGFTITPTPGSDTILCAKDSAQFVISQKNGEPHASYPPLISKAEHVKHGGFLELCNESFMNPKTSIASLLHPSGKIELYVHRVKCDRKGYMRFLKPACYIVPQDIYVHHKEVERVDRLTKGDTLEMLPHIKQSNMLKRADQITALYNKICIDHPIRINPAKIEKPIQSINLAWILAFCRKGYDSFSEVNLHDLALNAMAKNIRDSLTGLLRSSGKLAALNAKYYDEVDLATGTTVEKALSYKLPPDLIISVLSEDSIFKKYLLIEQLPQETPPSSTQTKIKKSPKAKTLNRTKLENFVSHLIADTSYNTYSKFRDAISTEYLYKTGNKPSDDETYNEHGEVKRVYGIFSKEKNKYLVNFSFTNTSHDNIPQKPYSLSSFKNIFDKVASHLRNQANKPVEG